MGHICWHTDDFNIQRCQLGLFLFWPLNTSQINNAFCVGGRFYSFRFRATYGRIKGGLEILVTVCIEIHYTSKNVSVLERYKKLVN